MTPRKTGIARPHACVWCGGEFPATERPSRRPRLYCSRPCSDRARRSRTNELEVAKIDRRTRKRGPCGICGREVPFRRGKFCSDACMRMADAQRQRSTKTGPQFLTCAVCSRGFEFNVVTVAPMYCSKLCQSRGRARLASTLKRRLERRKVETAEKVTPLQVFERDGFRCHICTKPLDMTKGAPHPLSPSVDHIVPISKGGQHQLSNLRAAHLRCNIARGNRAAAQLRAV